MANSLYDKGRQKFAEKLIDWVNDDIRVMAVTAGYARNLATDEFVSDIGSGNIKSRSVALTSKSVSSAGVCDADDATLPTVPAGTDISQLVLYLYNASDGAAALIGNLDTGAGLPFTPNGTDQALTWSNGANKIFKL